MDKIKNEFLEDHFILGLIIVNALLIFMVDMGLSLNNYNSIRRQIAKMIILFS